MRFYMKQKVWSWREEFSICDEQGIPRYYVRGELFSWGHKLHIYEPGGREIAYLEQKLWSFLHRFRIYITGTFMAEIAEQFAWFSRRYQVLGPDWDGPGDVFSHEYSIHSPLGPVAYISKEWFTWGDSYCIDVPSPQDEILAICVALGIDCCQADHN